MSYLLSKTFLNIVSNFQQEEEMSLDSMERGQKKLHPAMFEILSCFGFLSSGTNLYPFAIMKL